MKEIFSAMFFLFLASLNILSFCQESNPNNFSKNLPLMNNQNQNKDSNLFTENNSSSMGSKQQNPLTNFTTFRVAMSGGNVKTSSDNKNTIKFYSDNTWQVFDENQDPRESQEVRGYAQPVKLNDQFPPFAPKNAVSFEHPTSYGWQNLENVPEAQWIWSPGTNAKTLNADLQGFFFVKNFELPTAVASAVIFIAVDDFAEIIINNQQVSSVGSITNVSVAASAQQGKSFDITRYLVKGTNTFIIHAKNGPSSFALSKKPCTYSENPAGVVFGGYITLIDENTKEAKTLMDNTKKTSNSQMEKELLATDEKLKHIVEAINKYCKNKEPEPSLEINNLLPNLLGEGLISKEDVLDYSGRPFQFIRKESVPLFVPNELERNHFAVITSLREGHGAVKLVKTGLPNGIYVYQVPFDSDQYYQIVARPIFSNLENVSEFPRVTQEIKHFPEDTQDFALIKITFYDQYNNLVDLEKNSPWGNFSFRIVGTIEPRQLDPTFYDSAEKTSSSNRNLTYNQCQIIVKAKPKKGSSYKLWLEHTFFFSVENYTLQEFSAGDEIDVKVTLFRRYSFEGYEVKVKKKSTKLIEKILIASQEKDNIFFSCVPAILLNHHVTKVSSCKYSSDRAITVRDVLIDVGAKCVDGRLVDAEGEDIYIYTSVIPGIATGGIVSFYEYVELSVHTTIEIGSKSYW